MKRGEQSDGERWRRDEPIALKRMAQATLRLTPPCCAQRKNVLGGELARKALTKAEGKETVRVGMVRGVQIVPSFAEDVAEDLCARRRIQHLAHAPLGQVPVHNGRIYEERGVGGRGRHVSLAETKR